MTNQPGLSFRGTLERAYRRACRAGIAEVGTDLVFCYAAVRVDRVRIGIPSPMSTAWRPVRRGKPG